MLIDPTADIDLAAKRTVWGRNMNGGQQCISPDFVLCHKDVVDEFCTAAARWTKTFYGDEPKESSNFGRIVGDKQMARVVEMLKNHGGQVVCGGEYVVAPWALGCVSCRGWGRRRASAVLCGLVVGPMAASLGRLWRT